MKQKKFGNHSFFFACKKSNYNEKKYSDLPPNISHLAGDFINMISRLNDFARECQSLLKFMSPPIYLYGGHVFSQMLLVLGIDQNFITGILDNSAAKVGKRLYGTELFVESPQVIACLENPCVILVASHYQNEIKAQLININPNVRILEVIN